MGQSWSGVRRRLEQELLAESLRGRVRYFMTKYPAANDDEARFSILIDNKEMFNSNVFTFWPMYIQSSEAAKKELNTPERQWNGKHMEFDSENKEVEQTVEDELLYKGIFPVYAFTNALREYFNQGIEKSICSENPLIRILAVLDRRVGKRTIERVSKNFSAELEWVQPFYKLRLEAENVEYEK
ncbi:hypothetical protein SAMN02745248_01208 [Hathewaya proteolytica DSM 3090]|uniref:Uncharacterized protein n=1 Tax=Hathewaya proteolytica DSM 3090 TaxID=1121331 RepID=A0A1M6MWY1_9CLOT|nr:hypothetical protein [Hathewaya proteolytica]SHJ87919.1 hypothetical protein SAMN02745248_01208 [Hathewaya proteolytica DSM 3090]